MANDPALRLSSRELRYYDCSAANLGQMNTLGAADLPRAFESGCYFARKFDIDRDPEILNMIDAHLANASSKEATGRREDDIVFSTDQPRAPERGTP